MHRKLMGDHLRNRAFYDALKRTVVPNKTTVLDIGAGTGFLSFLASQLGAKECSLVESDPDVSTLSMKLAEVNKIQVPFSFLEKKGMWLLIENQNRRFIAKHTTEVKMK